jgi:hypothetical protein
MSLNIPHIILDAARMGEKIGKAKELNPDFCSLYHGMSEQSLASVAPYLFPFDPQTEFGKWYMQNGWGDSWGILVYSESDLKSLVKHFRHFLMVKKEDGEQLYFRFYDPRVLRVFLPTCDEMQLRDFFGPIDNFIGEDEDPANGLVFSLHNGQLKVDNIKKDEVVSFHPGIKKRKFWLF